MVSISLTHTSSSAWKGSFSTLYSQKIARGRWSLVQGHGKREPDQPEVPTPPSPCPGSGSCGVSVYITSWPACLWSGGWSSCYLESMVGAEKEARVNMGQGLAFTAPIGPVTEKPDSAGQAAGCPPLPGLNCGHHETAQVSPASHQEGNLTPGSLLQAPKRPRGRTLWRASISTGTERTQDRA